MTQITQDDILHWINQLPLRKRLRLAAEILANLSGQLPVDTEAKKPLRSLYGIWHGFSVTAEDITQARREMWGMFAEREL